MPNWTTTAASAEYVHSGATTTRGLYSSRRKYSMSDLIVWQERNWAKLDNLLRVKARKITVDDPEPKVLTAGETPVSFDLKSDGTDTTYEGDTQRISDTLAKWLQAGDVLQCPQLYCDTDGANYTTTKFGAGYMPETMIVQSVTLSGASSGVANVLVRRGNGNNTAAAAAGTVQTMLSEYKLVKISNALADGGDAAVAKDHEPAEVQNYLQFHSRTVKEDSVAAEINIYGKETFEQKTTRKRREAIREAEFTDFFGYQGKHTQSGASQRTSGGIVEYIATSTTAIDGTSRFFNQGGALDLDVIREDLEVAFRYGSETKWLFAGGQFFSALYNLLDKKLVYNDTISKQIGFRVNEWDCGHGNLMITRCPLFTEYNTTTMPYGYDGVGVDLEYIWLMTYKNHDWQMRDLDPGRAHTREREIFGMTGLRRTHPTAHFYIHGITG